MDGETRLQGACEKTEKGGGAREDERSRASMGRGMTETARLTGKALRAFQDALDATGSLLTAPIRKREAALPLRASRKIKEGQKRVERLERQLAKLKTRLGERLAQNALEGMANPAEESEAGEIIKTLERKSVEAGELQDVLESLGSMVTLLEERLASARGEEATTVPAETRKPSVKAGDGARTEAPGKERDALPSAKAPMPKPSQQEEATAKAANEASSLEKAGGGDESEGGRAHSDV